MRTRFDAAVEPIGPELARELHGVSWRPDPRCPPLSALRLLRLTHLDYQGQLARGELVVAARVVDDLLSIFERLLEIGFRIERMRRIDFYGADDDRSMAANNSSAFNFRVIAGTNQLSHHALGVAVDLNPRTNPMFIDDTVQPPNGCRERHADLPGVILRGGPVVEIFERHGWHWGGEWPDLRDTHHFSLLPRSCHSEAR